MIHHRSEVWRVRHRRHGELLVKLREDVDTSRDGAVRVEALRPVQVSQGLWKLTGDTPLLRVALLDFEGRIP